MSTIAVPRNDDRSTSPIDPCREPERSALEIAADRLAEALAETASRDPDLARAIEEVGVPPPRLRPHGFATLLRVITAQQISTKAASAIWARLEVRLGGEVSAQRFSALDEHDLRAIGFSRQKAAYGRGLAGAIADGTLPLDRLHLMPDEEVLAHITALKGFGRWSAEIYLLFALGRRDVFPADDLALQVGFQRLKRLEERPKAKALRALVEPWSPHRGAGAVFLWHYYGAMTLE